MMSMLALYYLKVRTTFLATTCKYRSDNLFDLIQSLPLNDKPDVFGLHDNADISFANNESIFLLNILLMLQSRTGGGGGSIEDVVMELFH